MRLLLRYRLARTRADRQARHASALLARRYLRQLLARPAPLRSSGVAFARVLADLKEAQVRAELETLAMYCYTLSSEYVAPTRQRRREKATTIDWSQS